MNILIVDDSSFNRTLVESFLIKAGYVNILHADSAQEAFDQIKKYSQDLLLIDLILMDIMMPEINGIDACRVIKEMKKCQDIPIIMVTARTEPKYLDSAFQAGAIDYITKPVNQIELLARVRSALTLKHEMDRRKARELEILEIGSRIQKTLLVGKMPDKVDGISMAAMSIPSQQIDGDFYDFFRHNNQCVDILLGDVMGKGVPAALVGAATKHHFNRIILHLRNESDECSYPLLETIVQGVHEEVSHEFIELETFVTLCYFRFDLLQYELSFVDCGHTRSIHYHSKSQTCTHLKGKNLPLGMLEEEQYKQHSIPIEPGDVIVLYSDGLTEAKDIKNGMFGENRLIACVQENAHLSPEECIHTIHQRILSFVNSNHFNDDFTCIAVKIDAAPKPKQCIRKNLHIMSNLVELKNIRTFVQELCDLFCVSKNDKDFVWQFEIAVVETTANIIKHAYLNKKQKSIIIEAEIYEDRIVVYLHHWGKQFKPPDVPPPPLKGGFQESGFGLFIINNCVDQCDYTTDNTGKNSIRLEKRRLNETD